MAVASTIPNSRKAVLQSPHPSTNNPAVRNKINSKANTKPAMHDSGGNYEAKLVEMINTSIVDRSPSVKWEDVGKRIIYTLQFAF